MSCRGLPADVSTCLAFRLLRQRNRPALGWMNLGARRGSQHKSRVAGRHSRNGRFRCAKRSLAACNVGRRVISFGQFATVGRQTRRDEMITTWRLMSAEGVIKGSASLGTDGFGARKEPAELIAEGPSTERCGNYSASLVGTSGEKRIIRFVGRFV